MSDPRIAGASVTHFGKHPERTGRDLFAEAGLEALSQSGIDPDDAEALYYGNFMGELAEHQGHQGPLMAEAIGLDVPATRVEAACASAGTAVREAVKTIRNGEAEVVVVGGAERMTNIGTAAATDALAIAADDLYEVRAGMTFPGAYALMARSYFDQYGGSHEDLAHIAVKNHEHALVNEHAQIQQEITVEDAMEAPTIADPLGLYDSCPITDGAAAAVLTTEAYAEEHDLDAPVAITGTGQGGDNLALQDRPHLAQTPAADKAAEEAYGDAGVGPDDVDFAEVHDCFTIAEVLAIESLGFYERGEGIAAARNGETTRDGDLPINLSGGLKAKGHPVGATGVAQLATVAWLLDGSHPRADAVPDSTVGVAHNAGGTVASTTVHVMEVQE
ncbi:thiolase domain-containing protein [Haloarcula sp. KBTZ06]|uniref:Thiolase domain-containing protein n=2 Tax=Haloarcula TaxID=2237 RepID=A0A5J5LK73_HALHI|nr:MULTISPECIES: thiolase domain-containing protein [Haloarcula]EMA22817.1 acetyl-CoA C-acetyltransferase/3-ketoacyl-CoA thiolase [Haloarcula amylolytica JCM 13557]KAA9409855.1 thiolase domain-containing protein [Haloarcula hispanica]MUV49211.1 thiolase domain-containing protein [Haloarcula sp. CBA1122]